jgi:hypothetical protein
MQNDQQSREPADRLIDLSGRPRFAIMSEEPAGPKDGDITPSLVEMARAVAAICATRVLLLLAVIIGAPIWVYTVYEPDNLRIVAAAAYALVSVLPLVYLYLKRG